MKLKALGQSIGFTLGIVASFSAMASRSTHVLWLDDGRSRITTLGPVRAIPGVRWVDIGGSSSVPGYYWGSSAERGEWGGGAFVNAPGSKEQETDDKQGDPCAGESSGNPVVLYSGNKVEPELDFVTGGEMPLYLERTYNAYWSARGLFGHYWLSNFDYTLVPSSNGVMLWAQRPDGRRIKFLRGADGVYREDKAEAVAYATKQGDGSYVLFNEENGVERYSADGFITELRNEQGVAWAFSYSGKYLQQVTHSSGRSIRFSWSGDVVTEVTDPAGTVYRYSYTANAFGGRHSRLASTTLPGNPATTISYHYESRNRPGALTGKSFNGERYSAFAYDSKGRAVSTEHAGGVEKYTFSYAVENTSMVTPAPAPVPPGGYSSEQDRDWCEYQPGSGLVCYKPRMLGESIGPQAPGETQSLAGDSQKEIVTKVTVTETNPLGRVTRKTFVDGKQISVAGDASPNCPSSYKERTYDANGYPDIVHDFADNVTDFDYDPQGHLLKKVEAAGSAAARTTLYKWDLGKNRLLRKKVEGDHERVYAYTDNGRLASVAIVNLSNKGVPGQARTTTHAYTYHDNGILASATSDGPLAEDAITFTYDSIGNLLRVRNELGQSTTYSGYNGLGLAGKVVGSNGEVTEYEYDARGRVLAQKQSVNNSGHWAVTRIAYNGAGDIAAVTRPDGMTRRYHYDAARRLMEEVEPEAAGTYSRKRYTRDAMSNVVKTEILRTDYPPDTLVTGNIEAVTHDGAWNWSVVGWACTTGSNASIEVHAYAYANGGSTFLVAGRADLASEPAVADACQSNGSAYRFQLPITLAQRQQLGGQSIAIYGISPIGVNRAIAGSGGFSIPTANVIGDIGGITQDGSWNYFIEGWACSVGVNSSIDVHLYVGGPAGSGAGVSSGTANLATGPEVAHACQSQGNAYGFRLPLDENVRASYGNQPIYIHGISPVGGANLLINRSGSFAVPAIVRDAEVVGWSTNPGPQVFSPTNVTMTLQMRNNGNVIWHPGSTQALWGGTTPTSPLNLSGPVAPGQIATFIWQVNARSSHVGNKTYTYSAQMASSGGLFGARASTYLHIEYVPTCPGCIPIRSESADSTNAQNSAMEGKH